MKLANKVAIVTGAASGIGRGIARAFAREGADIVIGDIDLLGAQKVADEIVAMNREALALRMDVSRSADVKRMVLAVFEKFGKVDILVNNAGGSARGKASLFKDSSEETWDFVIGRNLKGTMLCSRAVINHMIERKIGRIINISSVFGLSGGPSMVDYSAAKAGIIGFTKALSKEVSSQGVTVNAIAPGLIETKVLEKIEIPEETLRAIVVGRLGQPEDIAAMALLLASDDSSYITGATMVVSGGWLLP